MLVLLARERCPLAFDAAETHLCSRPQQVFMRALFHYDPREDRAIPCQEAGLPFQRRQVLEVVSQDDPTWWQAKRVGDTNLRAGLIPSKQFQERWVWDVLLGRAGVQLWRG